MDQAPPSAAPWARRAAPGLFALLALATGTALAAPPPLYHIEVIDKGKAIRPKTGQAISNNGIVAGIGANFDGGVEAAYVRSNGKTRKLDTQGSQWSGAYGVNSLGVTVGYNEFQATMWDANGVATNLSALMPCDVYRSFAYSVNDAGATVGTFSCKANTGDGGSFIFYDGSLSKLPDFGNGHTVAVGINKFGQVVGSSEYPPQDGKRQMHAFSWHNGVMTDIGTLPGDVESEATAVNDLGQIIGRSNAPNGDAESFVYVKGTMYPLPRCGGNRVITEAINNKGQIVGSYLLKRYEAALIQDGRCYQLNALLDDSGKDWWQLRAYDINDDGVIVGTGNFDNKWRGFIATPVKR